MSTSTPSKHSDRGNFCACIYYGGLVCPTVLVCMVVQCVPQLDFVNSRQTSQ
jgi:hypothetical protein